MVAAAQSPAPATARTPDGKELSATVADRRSGVVRSAAVTFDPKDRRQGEVSADVRPWLARNGKIRTLVTMNYVSHPHFSNWGQMKCEPLLESGKPLVVSQAPSAVPDRGMRIEVTATILKKRVSWQSPPRLCAASVAPAASACRTGEAHAKC